MANIFICGWFIATPITRAIKHHTITLWHWSARWPWEAICSIGWLGMIAVNEYAIGLVFLAVFAFGLEA